MKKLMVVLGVLFAVPHALPAQSLDRYGGLKSVQCQNKTRYFHVEKLGDRWWFCTPRGHGFFMQGVYVTAPADQRYYDRVSAKYGNAGAKWAEETNSRIKSWGFNTLGIYSSLHTFPTELDPSFPVDSHGLHSNPTKLPFIIIVRPALYSMRNPEVSVIGSRPERLLKEPVKNMLHGISKYYKGFRPGGGGADYFDQNMRAWLAKDLSQATELNRLKLSPYRSYLIGIGADDGDEMFGFGAGDEFPTVPPGHNNPSLSWLIATMSPVQTANAMYKAVYRDTSVYTKKAWRDMLVAKYGTISALNKAWGSKYSTFDSSGTAITGEPIASGDGSSLSFSYTLAHPVASPFSIQILVNGVPVAGDIQNGNLYGPTLSSGSVEYSSGRVTFTFVPGKAPARGANITVNYIQNGWGIGTGLMDEDGRPAHQSWLGGDPFSLRGANVTVKSDFDSLLYSVASQYLGMCKTEIAKAFPNILFLGPDSIGSWGAPPRAPVLEAAGKFVDVLSGPGDLNHNHGAIDYIAKYFGDKPIIEGQYRSSQSDSPWASYPVNAPTHDFPSQQARGQDYYNTVAALQNETVSATGSHPFIGVSWWQYTDNRSEKRNWGLVTLRDNAYDGHEDVTATVSCSPSFEQYKCGGEKSDYGDVISWLKKANHLWLLEANSGSAASRRAAVH